MGYTTEFKGEFKLDRPLAEAHRAYLKAFGATRHMKRDAALLTDEPDPIRCAAGLPIGEGGAYYIGSDANRYLPYNEPSILNLNSPPEGQPGLWCQWVPTPSGSAIEWDGVEKFYDYEKWIQYIIEHFLAPWGYRLNGTVEWRGEDWEDIGRIVITDNKIVVDKSP